MNEEKILDSIKKYVETAFLEDDSFDDTLLLSINGYVATLGQLCNLNPTFIDKNTTYDDIFRGSNPSLESLCKMYLATKVRLDFDPPQGVVHILERNLTNLEERIIIEGGPNAGK